MKPYAWVSLPENEIQILPFPDDGKTLVAGDGFYLYAHPVKELKQIKGVNYYVDEPTVKELTDEEIIEVRRNCNFVTVGLWGDTLSFARAILLKAQEK